MKEKILAYVNEHQGVRKRDIAGELGVWVCNPAFMHAISELVDDGELYVTLFSDPAIMECYYEYYTKNFKKTS